VKRGCAQARRPRREVGARSPPAQRVHVDTDRGVRAQRGERAEQLCALALLGERRGQLLRPSDGHLPLGRPGGNALEALVAGEHGGRGLCAPARQAGIAVRAVAHQGEPVRNRRGRDTELSAHSLLVAHLARAPIELDDPGAADALRQVLVRRAHDDLVDTPVALGHRRRRGQRVVGLELDHRPDDHAERPQRVFQRLELRAKQRIDPLAGLVAGPERIAKGLDDVIGGHAHMRGPALEHAKDRSDDPAHRSQLRRRAPVEGRRRREEIAEQLVGPVDQMDDHEWTIQ
jgi:hypothetical protein